MRLHAQPTKESGELPQKSLLLCYRATCTPALFQVLPPALASRAHAWHNELNVKEGCICWDNIYFEAPGVLGGHLNKQQVGCGALSLLSIYSISLFLQKQPRL